jgi:hypothetical protein
VEFELDILLSPWVESGEVGCLGGCYIDLLGCGIEDEERGPRPGASVALV